ncbi:hypothetical protein HBHAL_3395 [Halobacillus halophilus DSM 2266]|uniref:Uncharacterized protein n=1 Tax=Halobacillus halophilus (strain ATCC 35676 / DSM 2266 / JCM 20832 / KCTC 3685 / LMG 17431 / NBRC 102448 / NCIMB 2269) TaxID=866895 RepID=I0JNL8_HALH3|nr:hypothetical protein HBHAL_3395 [Halobacillus halophilus DSM 2266]
MKFYPAQAYYYNTPYNKKNFLHKFNSNRVKESG